MAGTNVQGTINLTANLDVSKIKSSINQIKSSLAGIKMSPNLQSSFTKAFSGLEKSLDQYEARLKKGFSSKSDVSGLNKNINEIIKYFSLVDKEIDKIQSELGNEIDLGKFIKIPEDAKGKIQGLKKEIEDLKQKLNNFTGKDSQAFKNIAAAIQDIKKVGGQTKTAEGALAVIRDGDIAKIDAYISKIQTLQKKYPDNSVKYNAYDQILTTLRTVKGEGGKAFSDLDAKSRQLQQTITETFNQLKNGIITDQQAMRQLGQAVEENANKIQGAAEGQRQYNQELDQMKSRIQYFFGINNAINLLQRSIRDAIDTVKELDAAMTETAVVTDFSVGDMWEQLPRYTQAANELGTTTLGAYETMTLFYQQGLNTQQAFAIGTETMKMARIANMDYAEATDMMTAALRGFNMELNEASAQRVNDVYSELAAITAADTNEIATAMTKTASIAASANMEFETTAALLSQIIETTREAPETAGTAMKTIIARFTEVKKAFNEGKLGGKDSEGEVFNINKIDEALKTVGMSLQGFLRGEEGIDDIFLQLASKWDTLDLATQRYIATMAAGSRQQSRFLAMMSDYDRTMELVSAANDSAGASQTQFEKTIDSLESKLNKLKNAWDQFVMGIANSTLIKGGVDVLTQILNTANKITEVFGNGMFSSIMKVGLALNTLKLGKMAIGGISKTTPKILNTQVGQTISKILGLDQFFGGLKQNTEQTQAQTQAANGFKGIIIQAAQAFKGIVTGSATTVAGANTTNGREGIEQFIEKITGREENREIFERSLYLPESIDINSTPDEIGRGMTSAGMYAGTLGKLGTWANTKGFGQNTKFGKYMANSKLAGGFASLLGTSGATGAGTAAGALASLAGTIGVVAASAAAAGVAIKALYDASPQGQLKEAQKLGEIISQNTAHIKKQTKESQLLYDTYNNNQKAITEATTTSEREAAIEASNEQILEVIEKMPELASSLKWEDGQLTINADDFSAAVDKLENVLSRAEFAEDLSKATIAAKQAQLYQSKANSIQLNKAPDSILTTEEKTQIIEYELKAQQAQKQADAYSTLAFSKMFDSDVLAKEMGQFIGQLYGATFDEGVNATEQMWGTGWFGRTFGLGVQDDKLVDTGYGIFADINQQYVDTFGTAPEADMSRKEKIAAIQAQKVADDTANDFNETVKAIETNKGLAKLVDIAGQIKNNEFFGEIDFSNMELADLLSDKIDPAILQNLFGTSNFKDIIVNLAKEQSENFRATQEHIGRAFIDNNIGFDINKLNTMSFEQQAQLSKAIENFEPLGDNALTYLSNFTDQLTAIDSENFSKYFENIDFSNPIAGAQALQRAMESNNKEVATFASGMAKVSKEALGGQAQLKYLFSSTGYSEIADEVSDLIKENNKLTADNIYDLADGCSELSAMLDLGTVSAEALAWALTGLEDGSLIFDNITNSILDAISSVDTLSGKFRKLSKELESFTPGQDYMEGLNTIGEDVETLNEEVGVGNLGSEKTQSYFDRWLTEDAYNDIYGIDTLKMDPYTRQATAQQKINQLAALTENSGEGAAQFLTQGGFLQQIGDHAYDFTGFGAGEGQYANLDDFYSQYYGYMAKAGFNETAADAVLQSYAAKDPTLMMRFNQQEQKEVLGNFAGSKLGLASGGRETIQTEAVTQKEIQGLADSLNIDYEDAEKQLKDLGLELPVKVTTTDELGNPLTGDALMEQFKIDTAGTGFDVGQYVKEVQDKVTGETSGAIDFGALEADLSGMTYDSSQIAEIANNIAEETGQQLEVSFQKLELGSDGVARLVDDTVIADSVEAAEQMIEQIQAAAQEDIQLKFQFQETSTDLQSSLQDAVDGVTGNGLYSSVLTALTDSGNAGATAIETAITGLQGSANITVTYTEVGKPAGLNGAAGGFVQSFAKGSKHRKISPGIALTGEEAPEIVWNKEQGYAYIAGQHGPEFNNLQPGDRVFNAAETRQILNRKGPSMATGGIVGAYSGGLYPSGNTNSGGGSGGSSGGGGSKSEKEKTPNEWKNDFDWLYNLVEDIAELEREQTNLQKVYELYLEDIAKNGHELAEITREQLQNLYEQYNKQEFMLRKRQQEMNEYLVWNEKYSAYGTYNKDDNTVEIDWDAIEAIQDEELYKKVEEYVEGLEDIQDKMDEAEEALLDIEKDIKEMQTRFEEAYVDGQDRIAEAIVSLRESEIENLSNINDTISNTNGKLLDAVNKTLQEQRQARENAKTEEEIAEKERRLSFLRQDTSGLNQTEILQLEEELSNLKEDYTDTLIDQKLSELQDQEDFAAEQRERQIGLLQSQLDYEQRTGALWEEVNTLIKEAMGGGGELLMNSNLVDILKTADSETWSGLSAAQKDLWEKELINEFKEVFAYLELGASIGSEDYGKTVTFINGIGEMVEALVDITGVAVDKNGLGYKGIYWNDKKQQWITSDTGYEYEPPENTIIPSHSQAVIKNEVGVGPEATMGTGVCAGCTGQCKSDCTFTCRGFCKDSCKSACGNECKYSCGTQATKDAYKAQGYATGGLADYTGPAWLDGTKSKPELVLNARDTANFIELKDILSSLLTNKSHNSNDAKGGDNYFNITVQAQIENDYDVEKLIKKVKEEIYNDGSYRNVNVIRNIR